jgi:hypothetical protein
MKNCIIFVLFSLLAIFLVSNTYAMSSTDFKLDWFVLLNGSGGGEASSTSYKINYTIGQTVSGTSTSSTYRIGLGYWAGLTDPPVYLPIILK